MNIGGSICRLRALEPRDLDAMYEWENDTEAWRASGTAAPFSRHVLSRLIDEQRFDIYATRQLRLVIEPAEPVAPIGPDCADGRGDRGRRPIRIRSAEPAGGRGHNRRIALPPTRFRRRRARRGGALRPRNTASASTLVQRRGRQRGQPSSVRKGGISPLRPSPRLASGRRQRTHRRDPFSENSR